MLFKRLKKARRAKKAKEINAQYLREKSLLPSELLLSTINGENLGSEKISCKHSESIFPLL
jgi:hypothetical protein